MMRYILACFLLMFSFATFAQEAAREVAEKKAEETPAATAQQATGADSGQATAESAPTEVGKHVGTNMDSMSFILSFLMILALIFVCAMLLKKFQPGLQQQNGLKVVTSLSLGAKERVVVVQAGEQQLLLGVTAHQITLLDSLEEPLAQGTPITGELGQSFAKLLRKS
ncbi:flagellar biosynthetic protein FliO [Thalassomonas haliotis]|uniref:Flagellar protein n=1 Tax=Thalassomonas haliotis TaxID=485448 RepID=A0ABY7VHP3_9GAMM|nr:flagellar biosynthetic protein FliO [Thalassomonas haliotis]WDE13244.1 flagellar biosynthetic protein FliO [Thalassomonas haliotis]